MNLLLMFIVVCIVHTGQSLDTFSVQNESKKDEGCQEERAMSKSILQHKCLYSSRFGLQIEFRSFQVLLGNLLQKHR